MTAPCTLQSVCDSQLRSSPSKHHSGYKEIDVLSSAGGTSWCFWSLTKQLSSAAALPGPPPYTGYSAQVEVGGREATGISKEPESYPVSHVIL